MTDALQADISAGPSTDALADQSETRPLDHKPQQKEPEDKAPASRSDAVQKAVDKVLKAEPEAKTDAADKIAKVAAARAARMKAKEENPAPEAQRGDDGKFKSVRTEAPQPQDGADAVTEQKASAYREAPQRFDDAAKKEWESVPEGVRGAIHRALRESEQGIQKYKETAEAFEPVREFDEMAKKSGTTLDAALRKYVNMENMLRQNPLAGLEYLVQNMGLKMKDGRAVTLRDVAEAYLARSPMENQNAALQTRLQMVEQQQKQNAERQAASEAQAYQRGLVEAAQREFPRFEELRPAMVGLIQSGAVNGSNDQELMRAAYEEADRRFPATNAAHTGNEALAQTQPTRQPNPAGQKSVTGAPGGEVKSSSKKLSRKEAIDKAMRQVGI